ncbi:MAG: nitroreductase [Deltaproteobacteria bacterium]|nr:nitroreductase [Deltaproteobacteria bacterium]
MTFDEVFQGRRSIRNYTRDPVPRQVIEQVLSEARWCPSWANTQPWEVMVVQGEPLERFRQGQVAKVAAHAAGQPDVPTPEKFEPRWQERVMQVGKSCLDAKGIAREDRDARNRYYEEMFTLFGAPVMIVFLLDEALNVPYGMMDVGIYMQSVCLVAQSKGLGTLIVSTVIKYPDLLRSVLPLPAGKRAVMGVALGHPDRSAPINQFERQRVPTEQFVTWVG